MYNHAPKKRASAFLTCLETPPWTSCSLTATIVAQRAGICCGKPVSRCGKPAERVLVWSTTIIRQINDMVMRQTRTGLIDDVNDLCQDITKADILVYWAPLDVIL
jgi:hypothetical protein